MPATTSEQDVMVRELLEEACARNQTAEIQFYRGKENILHTAHVRLLGVDEHELRTDSPQQIGKDVTLAPSEEVEVYFSLAGKTYGFRTRVIRSASVVDLNARMQVAGMVLRVPTRVHEQQRRQDYRISLSSYNVPVALHTAHPENLSCAPLDAERYVGRLVNLSHGGTGVLVPAEPLLRFKPAQHLYLEFNLPDDDEPIRVLGEIRHVLKIDRQDAFRLGVQFQPILGFDLRSVRRRIRSFVAAEQRRELQKRR